MIKICYILNKKLLEGGNGMSKYDNIIIEAATSTGLSRELIKAIVKKESGFNPRCRLGNNYGLMQVTPTVAKEVAGRVVNVSELYNPKINIFIGAKYLSMQIALWKDIPIQGDRVNMGIASYNLGQGNIKRAMVLANRQGLNSKKWSHIARVLPQLKGKSKILTTRRINITLNYVEMVNNYMDEFSQIHQNIINATKSIWVKD